MVKIQFAKTSINNKKIAFASHQSRLLSTNRLVITFWRKREFQCPLSIYNRDLSNYQFNLFKAQKIQNSHLQMINRTLMFRLTIETSYNLPVLFLEIQNCLLESIKDHLIQVKISSSIKLQKKEHLELPFRQKLVLIIKVARKALMLQQDTLKCSKNYQWTIILQQTQKDY